MILNLISAHFDHETEQADSEGMLHSVILAVSPTSG